MREDALYSRLQPYLKKWGAISRVENSIESGTWDVHYCFSGLFGWIETKVEHSGKLYFERFQLPWARRYRRANAPRMFVMASITSKNGHMEVYTADDVIAAPSTPERKWITVRVEDLHPILVMKKPYDWEALRTVLTSA